jgi:3-deoxy-D-manno-octulosonate 8-phosphate phosphatase (KDO 8-P phosphatase)
MPEGTDGWRPVALVLDVDGVMTTGQFLYTAEGKAGKMFGPDDHDALLIVKEHLPVHFVSGDRRGFHITHRRIAEDMKFPVDLVNPAHRLDWIAERWDPSRTIYMGDSLLDLAVFAGVGYSICPADGFYLARRMATHVTQHSGGNRAVTEACIHIMDKFFGPFDPVQAARLVKGGVWHEMGG